MEEWQKTYIKEILPKLIELTEFNCNVLVVLLAESVLSDADVDDVEAKPWGKLEKSYHYYQILFGRKAAYEKLAKALFEARQSGAANLLMEGFIKQGETRPLTACRISISYESFPDADIMVQGQLHKVKNFFEDVDIKAVEEIFRAIFSEMDYYAMFISKEQTFELIRDTIPAKPPYYVPRYLSNRTKIDAKIFEEDCVDIFVFKGVERHHLSDIARPHFTALSTSQREELTERFIILDYDEDLSDILELAKVPVHLLKYDSDRNLFILEYTTDPSGILKKFLEDRVRVYMTEEEFVHQEINSVTLTQHNGVCICDNPGMGKTLLLANVARNIVSRNPKQIVAFIPLSRLLETISHPLPIASPDCAEALLYILGFLYPNVQHAKLMLRLVKESLIHLFLFLDGFDEIHAADIEWSKRLLKTITASFPTIKVYVTSRSHMRRELESTMGVLGYDILQFTNKNQVDFLQNFWSTKFPQCSSKELRHFASHCLEMLRDKFSEEDREITGIPLLCQLIAEVYAKEAFIYSTSARKATRFKSRTIIDMYKSFIDERIQTAASQQIDDRDILTTQDRTIIENKIKRSLLWQAMNLLFPQEILHNLDNLKNIDMSDTDIAYRTGILQQRNIGQYVTVEFVHRTFAEFIVAEYVLAKLFINDSTSGNEQFAKFVYNTIFETKDDNETMDDYGEDMDSFYYDSNPNSYFKNPVTVYFLNCLNEQLARTSSNMCVFHVGYFCQIVSPSRLLVLLKTSCHQNMTNIFSLFLHVLNKCNSEQIQKFRRFFDKETGHDLVTEVIRNSKSRMIYDSFELCTLLLPDDVLESFYVNKFASSNESDDTLLQIAVENGNYEAVEYLSTKCPLQDQVLLERCIQNTYVQSSKIIKRKIDIIKFLLKRDLNLLIESPNLLVTSPVNLELLKLVIKYGTSLFETAKHRFRNKPLNCVMFTSTYMSPEDYYDFVRFVLLDCNEDRLFRHDNIWGYPLEFIMTYASLLTRTINMLVATIEKDERGLLNGENLLFSAVRGNKLHTARQLVACGFQYEQANDDQKGLLHVAAEHGSPDIIKYLLTLGLDINCVDKCLNTPLHLCKNLCTLNCLADSGGNMELQNSDGDTAAHKILLHYPKLDVNEIVLLICSHSTSGNIFNIRNLQSNTFLHILFKEATDIHIKTLEVIFKKSKVDINVTNKEGISLTMLAVQWSNQDLLKCLAKFGADVLAKDMHGKCLLHYSVNNHHIDTTKFLLSLGLDVNHQDHKSNTPLYYCKLYDVADFLVKNGAKISAQGDKVAVDTFAYVLQGKGEKTERKLFEFLVGDGNKWNDLRIRNFEGKPAMLISSGKLLEYPELYSPQTPNIPPSLINQKDGNGNTLLLLAAKLNRVADVHDLIKHGADINVTNNEGHNLVHIFSLNDNINFVENAIKEWNMDTNTPDTSGNTPILLAAKKSKVSISTIDAMIKLGADQHLKNSEGQGILHLAAKELNLELLQYCLKELQIDPNNQDIKGNTPISLAAKTYNLRFFRESEYERHIMWVSNSRHWNIAHVATSHRNMELLKFGVKIGMDVKQKDLKGESASFMVASNFEISEVLKFLKFLRSHDQLNDEKLVPDDYDVQNTREEDAALLLAAMYTDVITVRKLIERGADHNSTCKNGQNILHIAAQSVQLELVKFCLGLGLNPNLKGGYSKAPIEILQSISKSSLDSKKANKCLGEMEEFTAKKEINK